MNLSEQQTQEPTEAEKERVRKEAEAKAKAAAKRRDEERRREANDPKTVEKAETGEEPLDTQICRTYGKVNEENEGERRERNLREREGPEDFVPPRRPLDEEDGDVAVETAAEPAQDRRGHKGGFA
jgi:hypothetical protein